MVICYGELFEKYYLPVSVYEGIEGEAVSPAGGKILDVDLRVPGAWRNLL